MADHGSATPPEDSGSDSNQSEVGEAREEYFSEDTSNQARRSERLAPTSVPPTDSITPPVPQQERNLPLVEPMTPRHTIVQKWYEEGGYVTMCWHVYQPGMSSLYLVDGTLRDSNQPEVYEHLVSPEYAFSGRLRVLSVPESVAKVLHSKIERAMSLNIIPTKKDWQGWLEPLSASAHI